MLGAPEGLDWLGLLAAAMGLVVAAAVVLRVRRRIPTASPVGLLALAALACAAAAGPLLVWRIGHDLSRTVRLAPSERRGAGPVEAFLQPYLLDDAARALPAEARYAAVAGPEVPFDTARRAFPSLALNVLFPRIAVEDPADAEWIVAWGVDPGDVAPVKDVRVVTPPSGAYPAVVVARVVRR